MHTDDTMTTSDDRDGRPGDADHLLIPLLDAVREAPDRPMASVREGDVFVDRSAMDIWQRVEALARGLIARGVDVADRVALMSSTRVEWLEVDLAISAAGAATVPIYDTSSAEQIDWILTDSGAKVMVCESNEMRGLVSPDSGCAHLLTIDDGDLDVLIADGAAVDQEEVTRRIAQLRADSVATLIYTSGTTGRPKGCVLTHGNLRSNVHQITDALGDSIGPSDTALVFLPLAHILSKTTVEFALDRRVRIAFGSSIAELPNEFAMVQPTVISSVPRIFEKVYAKAQHTAATEKKSRIFEHAAGVAQQWSRQRAAGKISISIRAQHAILDRLLYTKIKAGFGGELRMAFSGGGPLGERLCSFFDGIGIRIYEGYGLTETSPILTINRTDGWKPGTVGLPVADTEVVVADDGELLVAGPQVFSGYWQNQKATDESFDDQGRFRTGDIGEFDHDGFLRITGRKKELIVTSAGKNVAPQPMEDRIRSHRLISHAIVIGDNRPFVAALITIDEDAIRDWQAEQGLEDQRGSDVLASDALRDEIQGAVDAANTAVSRAESIREFRILPNDLTEDRGEVTPTLKVRRAVVQENWSEMINSIYGPTTGA